MDQTRPAPNRRSAQAARLGAWLAALVALPIAVRCAYRVNVVLFVLVVRSFSKQVGMFLVFYLLPISFFSALALGVGGSALLGRAAALQWYRRREALDVDPSAEAQQDLPMAVAVPVLAFITTLEILLLLEWEPRIPF